MRPDKGLLQVVVEIHRRGHSIRVGQRERGLTTTAAIGAVLRGAIVVAARG